jgi:hypothetical protein
MSRMLQALLRRRSWTLTLAARHRQVAVRRPWPDMVLVPAWPAGAPGERHQHLHWSVSRHLQLAVRPILVALARPPAGPLPPPAAPAAPAARAAGVAAAAGGGGRVEGTLAPLERVVVGAAALEAGAGPGTPPPPAQALLLVETCRRTLRRVVEERRRVERWAPAVHPGGARPPGVPDRPAGVGPPPPVAWLPTPPAAAATLGDRRAAGLPPSSGPPPGWALATRAAPGASGPGWGEPAPAPPVATPIDVGQLTEQVVRQIDREIIAHRERMGRM